MNIHICKNCERTIGKSKQVPAARSSGGVIVTLLIFIFILFIVLVVFDRGSGRRGNVTDAVKWNEGKAMMGMIVTAIRAYCAEYGPNGPLPNSLYGGDGGLDFDVGELTGVYFSDGDFTFSVTSMAPATFTVSCTPTTQAIAPASPATVTLDQDLNWTPPEVGGYTRPHR